MGFKDDSMEEQISLRLTTEDLDALRKIGRDTERTVPQVIRWAVKLFLADPR